MAKESYLHMVCFDFFARYSSVSLGSDTFLWQHPQLSEVESLVLKAFRKKIYILVKGSAQPTPYQGSCLILHSIPWAALPAFWLPCCPGHCSPAESCLTLYLPWVTSSCACNDLRALQNCSPAVLCYSIAARQHFLMHFHYFQLLFICRLFCSISNWVRVSLYYLMFFFLPSFALLPSFPPLTWSISSSIALYSLLCSIPWLTAQEISVVCLGCSGGQGLRSGEKEG